MTSTPLASIVKGPLSVKGMSGLLGLRFVADAESNDLLEIENQSDLKCQSSEQGVPK